MAKQSIFLNSQRVTKAESEVFPMCRNESRYFLAVMFSLAMVAAPITHAATVAPPPGPPLSSEFSGPLWQILTPAGGTVTTSNAHMLLHVPAVGSHDALASGNQAVRALQPIGNVNFDVYIKIDSTILAANAGTKQGLMVVSDPKNLISYELAPDGTNIHLSAEVVANGVVTTVLDDQNFSQSQSPVYLRLKRVANIYEAGYSSDGTTWVSAATFKDSKNPALIGPFASNYNATPSKTIEVDMSVNWFKVQQ
jgi:hypothetical protein